MLVILVQVEANSKLVFGLLISEHIKSYYGILLSNDKSL